MRKIVRTPPAFANCYLWDTEMCRSCNKPRFIEDFFTVISVHERYRAELTPYCKYCYRSTFGHLEPLPLSSKIATQFDAAVEARIIKTKFDEMYTGAPSVMVEHSNKMGAARLQ